MRFRAISGSKSAMSGILRKLKTNKTRSHGDFGFLHYRGIFQGNIFGDVNCFPKLKDVRRFI